MWISKTLVGCLLAVVCSHVLAGEEKPWTEIRSPHFRLITNGGTSEGKDVLSNLEVMRAVFETRFPRFRLDSPASLTVLAAKDEATAKLLLPQVWAHPGHKPGGIYVHGWEREYALVRLDVMGRDPETFQSIYYEYAQSLLHINFHWLPPWLDVGLAEFYGHTLFSDEKMYIGAPINTGIAGFLAATKPIPLPEFLSSQWSFSDEKKRELSYMQAWALIHFLCFGPGMERGQRLTRFIDELQQGVEQKKAFIETIGGLDDVQRQYQNYVEGLPDRVWTFPMPAQVKGKDFTTRRMTLAETDAELAAWFIHFHLWDKVRAYAETAVKSDPKLSLAQEDMGFLDFNQGRDQQAADEFFRAYQLDDKNYRALFVSTMSREEDSQIKSERLNKVIELDPDFAPAYVELAKVSVAQGNLDAALVKSRRAVELEPFRAGYRIFTGRILLRMNRATEAAEEAAYVIQRWSGPDRDEAFELWDDIPAGQRPAGPPVAEASIEGVSARGTVEGVTCNGSDFTITLDVSGKPKLFKARGFPVGFSDTLWVGEDHFSPCFHVVGLRAMLRFRPAKDSAYTGDLMYVGFRDDLPLAPKSENTQAATH